MLLFQVSQMTRDRIKALILVSLCSTWALNHCNLSIREIESSVSRASCRADGFNGFNFNCTKSCAWLSVEQSLPSLCLWSNSVCALVYSGQALWEVRRGRGEHMTRQPALSVKHVHPVAPGHRFDIHPVVKLNPTKLL